MKTISAVKALAALAQESRLAVFRLLVRAGPSGLRPGDLAARLKLPPATLSFHLKELAAAGLVRAHKDGRAIHYAPDFRSMNTLLAFLTENCCQDQPCDPACSPKPKGAP